MEPQKFTFPKKEKLKSKKLIDQLFAEGKTITQYPLRLQYLRTTFEDDSKIKAGVTVSKRNFKSAVKRNRIKRLMREGYRHNKHLVGNNIPHNFAFMFLYIGKKMPDHTEISGAMTTLIHKFCNKQINDLA